MKRKLEVGKSGGASLYLRLDKNITIKKLGLTTLLSTKIKNLKVEISYDHHATAGFNFDDIISDFWGKVTEICDEEFIDWRSDIK
jgi:hypothetical protein